MSQTTAARSPKARYIMIGGFLGAGKTTAVAALAEHLTSEGLRPGLITNDQSNHLVDTSILRSRGYAVEEIAGGCFCCRFDSLSEAADQLARENRPDVFVAEPVGSCTDLVATVSYPLRRIYGDRYEIAPLSVLVDPRRAERVLGLDAGRSFSEKVVYVYRKQLEEADLIVVNKCDQLDELRLQRLSSKLAEEFPAKRILQCSAREGEGLAEWFDILLGETSSEAATMQVDYETYAEGEALLGWLNSTVEVRSRAGFDANRLLLDLSGRIAGRLDDLGHEIAHLKMTLESPQTEGRLAVVSMVSSGDEPDLRESVLDRIEEGTLVINLRAEADPDLLAELTESALEATGLEHDASLKTEHSESFRPGKPVPQHRVQVPG